MKGQQNERWYWIHMNKKMNPQITKLNKRSGIIYNSPPFLLNFNIAFKKASMISIMGH